MDDKQLVTIYPQKGLDALKALVIDGLTAPTVKMHMGGQLTNLWPGIKPPGQAD
jgi:hypothetical protein